jgi:hypothetical protein
MPLRHWNHQDEEDEGIWDTLVLGGKRMPGVARVSLKLPSGIKKRKATNKRGAGLRDVGAEPRELSIELEISTMEDLILADAARDLLVGSSESDPRDPLEIIHEAANYFNISTVVLGDSQIDAPSAVDGWKWTIQAFEWIPEENLPTVKDQKKKPQDDASAWLPFRDDGVAGSAAPPSDTSVHDNLPNPRG